MDYNNPVIDPGTLVLDESLPPGPLGTQSMPAYRDEITPIASYIAGEMNRNAQSPFVKGLAELNSFPPDDCIEDISKLPPEVQRVLAVLGLGGILARCVGKHLTNRKLALILWAEKVKSKADWDHKAQN